MIICMFILIVLAIVGLILSFKVKKNKSTYKAERLSIFGVILLSASLLVISSCLAMNYNNILQRNFFVNLTTFQIVLHYIFPILLLIGGLIYFIGIPSKVKNIFSSVILACGVLISCSLIFIDIGAGFNDQGFYTAKVIENNGYQYIINKHGLNLMHDPNIEEYQHAYEVPEFVLEQPVGGISKDLLKEHKEIYCVTFKPHVNYIDLSCFEDTNVETLVLESSDGIKFDGHIENTNIRKIVAPCAQKIDLNHSDSNYQFVSYVNNNCEINSKYDNRHYVSRDSFLYEHEGYLVLKSDLDVILLNNLNNPRVFYIPNSVGLYYVTELSDFLCCNDNIRTVIFDSSTYYVSDKTIYKPLHLKNIAVSNIDNKKFDINLYEVINEGNTEKELNIYMREHVYEVPKNYPNKGITCSFIKIKTDYYGFGEYFINLEYPYGVKLIDFNAGIGKLHHVSEYIYDSDYRKLPVLEIEASAFDHQPSTLETVVINSKIDILGSALKETVIKNLAFNAGLNYADISCLKVENLFYCLSEEYCNSDLLSSSFNYEKIYYKDQWTINLDEIIIY